MKYYTAEVAEDVLEAHDVYMIDITATVNNKKRYAQIQFDDFYAWIKCFHFLGYEDRSEPSAMCTYLNVEGIQMHRKFGIPYDVQFAAEMTERYKDYRLGNTNEDENLNGDIWADEEEIF